MNTKLEIHYDFPRNGYSVGVERTAGKVFKL